MDVRKKVRVILAREEAENPLPPEETSFVGSGKRDIPPKHKFDPKALKPLSRTLLSASVALGHSVTAFKEFTRIKSSSISPDGKLGGRGYVLEVKDVRAKLQQACELLSSVTDTMFDEINAPHWTPSLGELDVNEAEDITELVEEAGEVLEDPEKAGEKDLDAIESKNDGPGGSSKSTLWKDTEKGKASEVPNGGAKEQGTQARPFGQVKQANSSLPVDTLPGPRVNHLDRGDQLGPEGSYNRDEPLVEDAWGMSSTLEPIYGEKWATGDAWGEAAIPDGNDGVDTDANDFGLGFGAKGQGSGGYGVTAPDGRGVWGPSSDLPQDLGAPTTAPQNAPYLNESGRNVWASSDAWGVAKLPTDSPVARSDYYDGDKGGNQFNVLTGDSQLPGQDVSFKVDVNLPNVGYSYEHQDVPYAKYDSSTHSHRHDQQDLWNDENFDRVGK